MIRTRRCDNLPVNHLALSSWCSLLVVHVKKGMALAQKLMERNVSFHHNHCVYLLRNGKINKDKRR